jgi:hypothetical protein
LFGGQVSAGGWDDRSVGAPGQPAVRAGSPSGVSGTRGAERARGRGSPQTISERLYRRLLRRTRSTARHSLAAPITRAARSQLSEGVIRVEEHFRGGATDFERSLDLWL